MQASLLNEPSYRYNLRVHAETRNGSGPVDPDVKVSKHGQNPSSSFDACWRLGVLTAKRWTLQDSGNGLLQLVNGWLEMA